MSGILTIAITGGPCAGKTCSLPLLRDFLAARGCHVLTIPETATELMQNGAGYSFCGSSFAFQCNVFELQREKEDLMKRAARAHGGNVVILCDRGIPDGFAYMNPEDIPALLARFDTTREEVYQRYDAVFHLVSSAVGAPDSYGKGTNSSRLEDSVEEAVRSDRITLEAWTAHPHLTVIDSADQFEQKLHRLEALLNQLIEKMNT